MTQIQPSASRSLHKPESRKASLLSGALLGFLLVVFLTAFAYTGILFLQTARSIIVNTPQLVEAGQEANVPAISTDQIGSGDVSQTDSATLANTQSPPAALFAPLWNEQEPINILLLGIDQRPGQTGYFRTDTMIVIHIDPSTGDVGMLSMPP